MLSIIPNFKLQLQCQLSKIDEATCLINECIFFIIMYLILSFCIDNAFKSILRRSIMPIIATGQVA